MERHGELDNAESLDALAIEVGLLSNEPIKDSPQESVAKLHPIDETPDLLGVDISFVRQLIANDLISLVKSPQNRELVDSRDFAIIRSCAELGRFGIEPRNLRQYVTAANRESAMYEQVLIATGGAARIAAGADVPVDAAIIGIIDP